MRRFKIRKQTLLFCIEAVNEVNEAMFLHGFLGILVFVFAICSYVAAKLTPSLVWYMHSVTVMFRFNRRCKGLGKNLERIQGYEWLVNITFTNSVFFLCSGL